MGFPALARGSSPSYELDCRVASRADRKDVGRAVKAFLMALLVGIGYDL